VVYIAQKQLPTDRFAHKLVHSLELKKIQLLFEKIVDEIAKIWRYNQSALPAQELALDGQLSNWIWLESEAGMALFYIDTSTPLFRKYGLDQIDPELFLKSAPGFLRWIIRLFFLNDVMTRYYDQRQVYLDFGFGIWDFGFKRKRTELVSSSFSSSSSTLFEYYFTNLCLSITTTSTRTRTI
jgi:hypothetical protein